METLNFLLLVLLAIMLVVAIVRSIFFAPIRPRGRRYPPDSGDLGGGADYDSPLDSGSHHGCGHDGGHGGGDGDGGGGDGGGGH